MTAVAVIVAAYEPGRYLRTTLDSLLAQTLAEWECVVVDDGSGEDLSWVARVDGRVRLVRQPHAGVSAARNRAIAETSAPLLAFLDQDDEWSPGYLARQVAVFADSAVVLSSTGFEIVDADGVRLGPGFRGQHSSYKELLAGCGLALSTVMARRSAVDRVGGFRPFSVSQDWDLWLRLTRDGGSIGRIDEELGRWRRHDRNASRAYKQLWRDAQAILADHDHPAAKQGLRRVRFLSGVQAFDEARASRGRPRDMAVALSWALIHAPGYTVRSLVRR